jgi:N utilization substance protein B
MNNRRRPDGIDPVARSRSRRRGLQAIYAWQISGASERDLIAEFAHEQAHEVADLEYFEDLVRGVLRHRDELDAALAGHLDRGVDEVDAIERAALRIAMYELLHRPDVPYRVVINEAIDSTKRFGSEHGHPYVNGVLDKAAVALRGIEAQAPRQR